MCSPRWLLHLSLLFPLNACVALATAAPAVSCLTATPAALHVQLYVVYVIDKTFEPTPEAAAWVIDAAQGTAERPNTLMQIGVFSQAAGGRFAPILGPPIFVAPGVSESDVWRLRRTELAHRQRCSAITTAEHHVQIKKELHAAFGQEVASASHTEIAASLELVGRVFDAVEADRRVLVVVSDGLEHNVDQSFYLDRRPREVDPPRELARLERRRLRPTLQHVDVIWVGLGTANMDLSWQVYRPLQTYWTDALAFLGAHPIEIGTVPALPFDMLIAQRSGVGYPHPTVLLK